MVLTILIILLAIVLIKDTPTETKIKEAIINISPKVKEFSIEFFKSLKEILNNSFDCVYRKLYPSKWEYATSWVSKNRTRLHVKVKDQYGATKIYNYSCSENGNYMKNSEGQYVCFEENEPFTEKSLNSFWEDAVVNERYKDAS